MTDNERMVCSVCARQREQLTPKKSKLLKTMTLLLCNDCLRGNKEPRHLIILVGRTKGALAVLDYIRHHRYVGEAILAKEVLAKP